MGMSGNRSETPSDSLCTHTTIFGYSCKIDVISQLIRRMLKGLRYLWLMLCTFPRDKIKEFCLCALNRTLDVRTMGKGREKMKVETLFCICVLQRKQLGLC